MHRVHLDHWWVSRSELLALDSLRAALAADGIELTAREEEAEVSAQLMSAQRVWEGVCGLGLRPIDLSPYLRPYDLEARIFAPFRAVNSPSHLSLHGVPLGAFRNNSLWANRRIADQIGTLPSSIDEWLAWLRRAARSVEHPLGIGCENWQASLLFEVIVLAMHGTDFHRSAFGMGSHEALASARMGEALAFVAALRGFVSPLSLGRPWPETAASCRDGRCAAVVMGDWVHHEFGRLPGHAAQPYREVYKWAVPGTETSLLYNVDYLVPVERIDRPADPQALGQLTRTLLKPHVQCEFGLVKGALPAVRDAVDSNIDPALWKMFHLATLCPELLIPSMSLLQGSPRFMRDHIAAVVRGVLLGELSTAEGAVQIGALGAGRPLRPEAVACALDDHNC